MTPAQLEQGIEAAKSGRHKMARAILARVVRDDPQNEQGWFWLSKVAASEGEKAHCLRQVLQINPGHPEAQAAVQSIKSRAAPQPPVAVSQSASCPQCGRATRPGSKFCTGCGASLGPDVKTNIRAKAKQEPSAPTISHSAPPPVMQAPRTLDYQYPKEHQTLLITIGAIIVALFVFSTVSLGVFFVMATIAVGINYLFIRAKAEGTMRSALRVSDRQRPDIKVLVDECMRHVDISPDTRVFITQSPILNAYAFGLGKPYSIILNSALVKHLDADELKCVIGYEMGHIKFGHTNLLSLIGTLGGETFGIPGIGMLIRYAFLFWERASEFTADRAGLVACGRLDKAISTELKLGVGPELAEEVDMRELAQTWRAEKGNILGAFGEMQGTHPMMLTRIQQIIEFGTSDAYRYLRPDAVIDFAEAADWLDAPPVRHPPLQTEGVCSSCRNCIVPNWKVCPHCGTRLK
jgi:Zn-dependent protease with chaperone function